MKTELEGLAEALYNAEGFHDSDSWTTEGPFIRSRYEKQAKAALSWLSARLTDDVDAEGQDETADRWDAIYTPADVFDAGRTAGVIDALRAHGPSGQSERLLWVIEAPATDENPYEGIGDAVHILRDVEALLDDCDQLVDTREHPNLVKVAGVRQVLARYGGKPHRWSLHAPSVPPEGITPGGDPVCPVCGKWHGLGQTCDDLAPEGQPEGSEQHEHAWIRRQNVTTRGYVMDPYEACECGAARPAAPAPVPDDEAVEALALVLARQGESESLMWGSLDLDRETYVGLARAVLAAGLRLSRGPRPGRA